MQLQNLAQVLRVMLKNLALIEQLNHVSRFVFCKIHDVVNVEAQVFNEEVDDFQGAFLYQDLASIFLEFKFFFRVRVLSLVIRLCILFDKIIILNLVFFSNFFEFLFQ